MTINSSFLSSQKMQRQQFCCIIKRYFWLDVRVHVACVCVYSAQLFVFPLNHHPSLFNLAAEYSDLIIWANILISPSPLASTAGKSSNTPMLMLDTASRSAHSEECHVLIPPDIMCLSKSGCIVNQRLMIFFCPPDNIWSTH